MKQESTWTHSKYGKRKYFGKYEKHKGERLFVLSWVSQDGMKYHNVSFESWQMAKNQNWRKIK